MSDIPLRLAIDAGPLYGHRTGIGLATAELIDRLAQHGGVDIAPYVVSFRSKPRPGHRRLPLPGVVASHLWSRFDRPHADRWLTDSDVVHGTNYVVPPVTAPTVVSVYDCWFLERPDLATPTVRRAGEILRRAAMRGAWIHASSNATAERATSLLATERVAVVPLGPPPTPTPSDQLGRPPVADELAGRRFVLAVGTEERRKDLRRLIAAFELVAAEQPDVHLALAGAPGDASRELDDAIAGLSSEVRARTHRLGAVDTTTKDWLLRRAAALAYPSVDEGFGFPVLEAQLAATPVVASRAGSIPEVAGDGALLVDDGVESLADGLSRVLTGGVSRLGLIEAGHRNVARFDWNRTVEGMVELYRRAATTDR